MYKYIVQRLDINTDWADNTKQTGNNKIMIQQKETIRKERQSEMRNSQRLREKSEYIYTGEITIYAGLLGSGEELNVRNKVIKEPTRAPQACETSS